MKWKEEAVEKLRRYDVMHQASKNLAEEIRRLEQMACGLSEEDVQLNNRMKRGELENSLELVKSWLSTFNRAMAALSPEEKLILRRLYVYPQKGGLSRLCGDLGIEQSTLYRHRDRALRQFTLALYGREES